MSYTNQRPNTVLVEPKRDPNKTARIVIVIIIVLLVIALLILLAWFLLRTPTQGAGSPSTTNCTSNNDCILAIPKCNLATRQCVVCLVNSDCPTGYVCDVANGHICVKNKCFSNSDCPSNTPYCETSKGVCLQCTASSQCPVPGSICSSSGSCILPCTLPPDPVLGLNVSTVNRDQTISWTPPSFIDPNTGLYNGKAIRNYVVTREANVCSITPGTIVDVQIIPFGTNTATFSNLNDQYNCYRVASQNDCGETNINVTPRVTGTICLSRPFPISAGSVNYVFGGNCSNVLNAGICGLCLSSTPTTCAAQPSSPGCLFCPIDPLNPTPTGCIGGPDSLCPSMCTNQITTCNTTQAPDVICRVDLSWPLISGAGIPGAILISRTNAIYTIVENNMPTKRVELLNPEATLFFPLDPTLFFNRNYASWYVQCKTASTVVLNKIAKWTLAIQGALGIPNTPASAGVGPNPTVTWPAIAGVDEYAVTMIGANISNPFSGETFENTTILIGIRISVTLLADPLNPSYTFLGIPYKSNYVYAAWGFNSCDVSNPTPLPTVFI